MNWIPLTTETQLQQVIERSFFRPQAIYKHSTRCAISSVAKSRLERVLPPDNLDFNFLDLLANRSLSRKVEEVFGITHESPQLLLIKNGICVYHESHSGINMNEVLEKAAAA
jgi:bacillithiol system protein YtxJ